MNAEIKENTLSPEELVNMLNQELVRQNKCYKSRCKKAIEYIEERKNLNWYADGVFVDELLNILNGGEEDESITKEHD